MRERLLQALQRQANHRGLVIVREVVLREELRTDSDTLRRALTGLQRSELVEVLSPLPFLVLKCSGSGRRAEEIGPKCGPSGDRAYSAITLSNTKQLNSSYRQPGAHWPIDAALLGEILETLGETDSKSFEKAVELYSPHVIRVALDRVRRAKGIRKNRTALFRHLLPRLARDEHRFDQVA